jgi:hypothetical protein
MKAKARKVMELKDIDEGFNRIRPWLTAKLAERRLSVEGFCALSDGALEPTQVWRWYSDVNRPYAKTMKVVCELLSRIPIIFSNGDKFQDHVPWSEGLEQYSPRPRAWAAHFINRPS